MAVPSTTRVGSGLISLSLTVRSTIPCRNPLSGAITGLPRSVVKSTFVAWDNPSLLAEVVGVVKSRTSGADVECGVGVVRSRITGADVECDGCKSATSPVPLVHILYGGAIISTSLCPKDDLLGAWSTDAQLLPSAGRGLL